jgi:multiple sugar transport system permease protein
MSSTTTAVAGAVPRSRRKQRSLHRQNAWALWASYVALGFFVVIFLAPPFYTLMTSLKSSAEISAQQGSPWIVHNPTLENFFFLCPKD